MEPPSKVHTPLSLLPLSASHGSQQGLFPKATAFVGNVLIAPSLKQNLVSSELHLVTTPVALVVKQSKEPPARPAVEQWLCFCCST